MEYQKQLEEFKKLSADVFLVRLFEMGETEYNRQKLREELAKVVKPDIQKVSAPLPVELKEIQERRQKAYRLRDRAFYAAKHATDPLTRWDHANEVLKQQLIIDECWQTIEFFKTNSRLPPEVGEMDEYHTEAEKLRRIMTLRTYISQAKKGLKYKQEDIPNFKAQIDKLQREL